MYTTNITTLGAVAGTATAAGAASGATPLSGGGGGSAVAAAHALPFTGVNIFFLILSALTLILMGAALLRIGRTLVTRESVV